MDILVVDDNDGSRYAKRRTLQRAGFTVLEAASGVEALRLVATQQPSLVLLDINLPDISGLEVCRRIKSDPATAATIVVQISATFTDHHNRVQGLDEGAEVYLVEPIHPEELIATMRAMQRLRNTEHALRQSHDILESRVQERTEQLTHANTALQQEITERQHAEETLRLSHQFLQSTVDALTTPVAILDANGTIQEANTAWQRTAANHGFVAPVYSRGIPYATFLSTRDGNTAGVQAVLGGLHEVLARQRQAFHIEHTSYTSEEATPRWFLIHLTRFDGPEGLQVVAVHEDITDIKQAEAAIRHQQEMLFRQEKLASMGALLASVAHELNNPLAVVKMQLDFLDEEATDSTLHERVKELQQATERCMRIVRNFLTLARQNPPQRSPVQLHTIIDEALELLAHTLRLDNITVQTHFADDVPLFEADPAQMHQLIMNLLINAQQALHEHVPPRQIRITTRFEPAQGQVVFELADTGPGIPVAMQQRIFEPFFTTKPLGVGTGIGLSLCRSIVESHGGAVGVTSQPGQGAVFRIELPVGKPAPVAQPPEPVLVLPPPSTSSTILVVDDEPGIRHALLLLMRREGHKVDTAVHGQQALRMLQEQHYDLVLCDLRMPELDGTSLYQRLVISQPQYRQRFVFLTGDTLSPETEAFLAQTGVARLVKPFSADQGRQVVRQVLQHQR